MLSYLADFWSMLCFKKVVLEVILKKDFWLSYHSGWGFFFALIFFLPRVSALNESLTSSSRAELEQPFPAVGSALYLAETEHHFSGKLPLWFKALFWYFRGDSFSHEPGSAGTMGQGPELGLIWPCFVLGWDEMLSQALSWLRQRGIMCRVHQHQLSELHLADFSYPSLINMCNHRFFSQINFYLDDEGSCKPGTLPHEFTRLPFIKWSSSRKMPLLAWAPCGWSGAVWSPEHGATMLSPVTFLATSALIVLKDCLIKCLFSRNPILLKQIMSMIK